MSTAERGNLAFPRPVRDVRVLSTQGALRLDPMAEINGPQIFGLTASRMGNFAGPPPG